MRRIGKNQKGFGVVLVLVLVLVVATLGAAGYYVWHMQQNPSESSASATNVSPQSTPATGSSDTNTPQQPHYMVIKEWAIKIPLSDKFSYHIIPPGTDSAGDVMITESQLATDEATAQCPTSDGYRGEVATLFRYTSVQPGPAFWSPKINGYYYGFPDPGGTLFCTDVPGYNAQTDSVNPRFEVDQAVFVAAMPYITAE